MFWGCWNLNEINLSSFDTSNVKIMNCMFCACHNLKELNLFTFNTLNVEDTNNMFYDCYNLKKIKIKKEFKNHFKKIINNNNILLELK